MFYSAKLIPLQAIPPRAGKPLAFVGAQPFCVCISTTSQEADVGKKHHSCREDLTPAEESGRRSDGEVVHQKASGAAQPSCLGHRRCPRISSVPAPWSAKEHSRGEGWTAYTASVPITVPPRKVTLAADGHKGARASCTWKIHNLGTSSGC